MNAGPVLYQQAQNGVHRVVDLASSVERGLVFNEVQCCHPQCVPLYDVLEVVLSCMGWGLNCFAVYIAAEMHKHDGVMLYTNFSL